MALPLVLGLAALGAGTGYLQAQQQNRNNQANMLAQAAAARYSPWTGITPQLGGAQSADVGSAAFGGAAQGALGGYMQGKEFESTDLANQKNQLEIEALKAKKPTLMSQNDSAWRGMY